MKKEEITFPYAGFPYRMKYTDGDETRICYFQLEDDVKKFIKKYNLKKPNYTVHVRVDKKDG